ncbi:hypothetical protein DFH11DRAFT_210849 [Phellopilus nigrolimitatus]|nr:hypothetical protein DFH11DRAFT_210849 [Phellopilus nigrolimitatus]
MMFKPFAVAATLLASASLIFAAPAAVKTGKPNVNIVYNPTITSPLSGTVWNGGEKQQVTWSVADIPDEEKNSTGTLLIGYLENDSENLNIAQPLATGFKLTDAAVSITVPTVAERTDYIVVLFGDSGNASPQFTIHNGTTSA